MKFWQKTIAATAAFAFLLAAPITILAATPTASPTPTSEPTIEPTIAPIAATPAPQSTLKWIMTHKKISLGVLLIAGAIGYALFRPGKKNNQSSTDDQPKPVEKAEDEEEPKEEDQTPPEDAV